MQLIQMKELALDTSEAYILKTFRDIIVTNDEFGLLLYDADLNFLRRILWPKAIGAYMVYQNFFKNEMLIDCPEDGFLLYVDIDRAQIIEIPMKFSDLECNFLGYLYHWFDNMILFKASEGYLLVSIRDRIVKFVKEQKIEPRFLKFCNLATHFLDPRDMPGPFQFIYRAYDNDLGYYDFTRNSKIEVTVDGVIDDDVAYTNGFFCILNSKKIQVIKGQNNSPVTANKHQEFLVAQFQDNGKFLIILSSQFIKGNRSDYLTRYRIIMDI